MICRTKSFPNGLRQQFAEQGLFVSADMAIVDQPELNTWQLRDHHTRKTYLAVADDDYLSISTGDQGLDALREILKLYSVTNPNVAYIARLWELTKCMYAVSSAGRGHTLGHLIVEDWRLRSSLMKIGISIEGRFCWLRCLTNFSDYMYR